MTRPSLTPMTYCEFDRPKIDRMRWIARNLLRLTWRTLRAAVRGSMRLLVADLGSERLRKTLPLRLVAAGALMKITWMAPIVVLACGWVVYRQTHPPQMASQQGARVSGAYSERVSFVTSDNLTLSAVWVPAYAAEDIVNQPDKTLTEPRPAVILVHDHGFDARQMLPFAQLLHKAGVHVLALDLRGRGHSDHAPQTFGRTERLDVAAAVNYLSNRATVDPQRIAIWAVGTGAMASEQAPNSTSVSLLVAEGRRDDTALSFLPEGRIFDPLRPICRWTFSVAFAGGPVEEAAGHPRRVVDLEPGDASQAVKLLREFAADRLVASSQ